MHDSRNIDHIPFDSVDQAIGIPLEQVASEPALEDTPYGGMVLDLLER